MHDSTIALTRVLGRPSPRRQGPPPQRSNTGGTGCPSSAAHASLCASFGSRTAAALVPLITAPEVTRFMSPTPDVPNWFASFVASTSRERKAGRYAGFAIVPHVHDHAVGLVQIRQLAPGFSTAEWGIALGSPWWGKGLFEDTGRLILQFAFETLACTAWRRASPRRTPAATPPSASSARSPKGSFDGALRTADGQHHDQILWSWLVEEWRREIAARRAEELVWVH